MKNLMPLVEKYRELLTYAFFGVGTAIISFGTFYLFYLVFNFQYLVANAYSIIAAIFFAFYTNKKYVFQTESNSRTDWLREFFQFAGLRLVSGGFDMFSMWFLVEQVHLNVNLALILTQIIIVSSNYFFSKFLIFK